MGRLQPELATRAFETIEGLKKAASLPELEHGLAPVFRSLGIKTFAKARFYKADGRSSLAVLYGHPTNWGARYVERGYGAKSIIAREMLVRRTPYCWSDVYRNRRLDEATELIMNEAREFGCYDGLYLPVRDPDGSYAAVALCSGNHDLRDPFVRIVAEVLASYYASEGDRVANLQPKRRTLTPRQRECLAWVRLGKSSTDIAGILGLSAPTVDGHIADACRKLGVRTRIQAVVDACLLGLIDG
jgi:DNA-binding CsgD family transcriptional regulator